MDVNYEGRCGVELALLLGPGAPLSGFLGGEVPRPGLDLLGLLWTRMNPTSGIFSPQDQARTVLNCIAGRRTDG